MARQVAVLRQLAQQARELAARLAETEAVDWKSLAANRFRALLNDEARLTRGCADRLDGAAEALARHAVAVGAGAPARGPG